MKFYIIKEETEYTLFKIANNLVQSFENEYKENVLITADDIFDVLQILENIPGREVGFELNPLPIKYKAGLVC